MIEAVRDAGYSDGSMFATLNNLLCRILPGLAVLMLTAGPASSAAEAAHRGRVAERTRTEDKAVQPATSATSQHKPPPASQESKPSKHEADGGMSAYLVPAVAKPSEAKSTDYLAACATSQSSSRTVEEWYISCTQRSETPLKQLHCPAYQAHAPPFC